MKHKLKFVFSGLISCLLLINLQAQSIRKVLFIGNSYTQVNDLPQMIADIAHSAGDSLFYDSNTPGGYTFQLHSTNSVTLAKINSEKWDFVVLQEQSQLPSFPPSQVLTDVYPYADSLNAKIKKNDSCTITIFYMTWGRKNGDQANCAAYPPLCTYLGMQQRLKESYLEMANTLNAEVCPAGIAWKHLRQSNPAIELYQADESHPTVNGTYLVACTFYASIFHKSSFGTFAPAGIAVSVADTIQHTALSAVFDSLATWRIDTLSIKACYTGSNISGNVYQFVNCSQNATDYFWQFGDGATSTDSSPLHTYSISGNYNVMLKAFNDCLRDSLTKSIEVISGVSEEQGINRVVRIFPIPARQYLNIDMSGSEIKFQIAEISDYTGNVIKRTTVVNNKVNVSNLEPGYYFIRLISSLESKYLSFIKI